jgi:copper resistance protein C
VLRAAPPAARSLPAVLLAGLAALVVLAGPAHAHTRLTSSAPAAGGQVSGLSEAVLSFDDPVQPSLSTVRVVGPDGVDRATGPAVERGGSTVVQPVAGPLPPGPYRVDYRVVAADGHPITGSVPFEVLPAAPGAQAPADLAPPETAPPAAAEPPPWPETGPAAGVDDGDRSGGAPVLPLAAGAVLLLAGAGLLVRRVSLRAGAPR